MSKQMKAVDDQPKMKVMFHKKNKDGKPDLAKALEKLNSGAGATVKMPSRKDQATAFEMDYADGLRLITEMPHLYKEVVKK